MHERIAVARASGDHAQVIALASRLQESDPQDTDALVFRGFANLSSGDLDAAEKDFRTTLRLAPGYLDATLGLGYVSLRRGDARTAEMLAREVLKADEGYAEARELLALAQRQAAAGRGQAAAGRGQASLVASTVSRSDGAAAADSAKLRRTFSLDAGRAWGDREESELTLSFSDAERAGFRLVYGLRHTSRPSGDATQVGLTAFRANPDYTLGGELAFGAGADNLARFRIGALVLRTLTDGFEFGAEARWESFASSRLLTLTPVVAYRFGNDRGSLTLRAPTSFTSETGGSATVVDARLRLPLCNRFRLGLGYAAGEEFDAAARRDIRSAFLGLIAELDKRRLLAATIASGPYADTDQTRLNVTVVWRF
jgi:hypothetical protein